MKNIFPVLILISLSISCTERKAVPSDNEQEKEKVISVLSNYKTAVEKLDTTGTAKLFAADSKVFESGSYEGNYLKYETEHLGPEFSEFASFKYYNYNISVTIDMPYAFADETYRYEILIKADSTIAEREGAATTVLKKIDGAWKILISHNSSYKGKSSHN